MLKAVGVHIERLKRTQFGPVCLGELPPSACRDLTPDELDRLREALEGDE